MAKLAIITVNTRTPDQTLACLKSIQKYPPNCAYQILVGDNGSNDGSIERIRKAFPEVMLIDNRVNLGYAKANNILIKKAMKTSQYLLLLNPDTVVLPGALQALVDFADKTNYGIVSCKTINQDKTLQPNTGSLPKIFALFLWLSGLDDLFKKCGLIVPTYHQEAKFFYRSEKEVGWVSGSVLMIKRPVIKRIGFLDENIFMYSEDVDYCWRARQVGFRIGWTDAGTIIHIGGASFSEPKYKQWSGEFKGLFHLYQKRFGVISALLIRVLCYPFILLRVLAFASIGKLEHAKTYAKVIVSI